MSYSLSNLILLFPIACGLAIVLAMTGRMTNRTRPDLVRTFARLLVWQLLILAAIGLTFRMTALHVVWGFVVIGFAIQTLFWEYSLARNTVMLVWLSADDTPDRRGSIANYLRSEGRGYWQRLGNRLWHGLQSTGDWLIVGKRAGLVSDARTRIAMEVVRHCGRKELLHEELVAATDQRLLLSQLLGRLVAASLSLIPLALIGSLLSRTLNLVFSEFGVWSAQMDFWMTIAEWRLHLWIPLIVWSAILSLYALSFYPALTRYPPLIWLCRGYYRGLTLRCLAEFVKAQPQLSGACRGAASALPMPSWSSRLIDAALRIEAGAPLAVALPKSGLLKNEEAATLSLCVSSSSLSWALEQLAKDQLRRTFDSLSVLVQVLVVALALVAGIFVAIISSAVFSTLSNMITALT